MGEQGEDEKEAVGFHRDVQGDFCTWRERGQDVALARSW